MLTLILALAAGACLAVGWLLEQIVLVYVALAASGVGLALMAVQAWSRRRSTRESSRSPADLGDGDDSELKDRSADVAIGDDDRPEDKSESPSETAISEASAPEADAAVKADAEVNADVSVGADDEVEELVGRFSRDRIAEDSTVYVLSGRKRFHLVDCRLLNGRDTEELTLIDAQEEAFTPCTICVETETRELLAEQH